MVANYNICLIMLYLYHRKGQYLYIITFTMYLKIYITYIAQLLQMIKFVGLCLICILEEKKFLIFYNIFSKNVYIS